MLWTVSCLEGAAACRAGFGQGFAGQSFVALGRIIDECRDDGGDLFQVVFAQMVVRVHVGVVGPGAVFDLVLDELEAGKPYCVEGLVVGAAGIADVDGGGAEVVEGFQPFGKNGARGVDCESEDLAAFARSAASTTTRRSATKAAVADCRCAPQNCRNTLAQFFQWVHASDADGCPDLNAGAAGRAPRRA